MVHGGSQCDLHWTFLADSEEDIEWWLDTSDHYGYRVTDIGQL